MASLRWYAQSAVAAGLLVVGVAALAVGATAVPDLLTSKYHHEVSPIGAEYDAGESGGGSGDSDGDGEVPVYAFDELSTEGRAAFLAALNASDGRHATGSAGTAPEFTYDWDLVTAQVVRYQGTYYRVLTNREDVLWERIATLLLAIGAVASGIGAALWRRRPRRSGESGEPSG